MLRFSQRAVPVGQVPSQGRALTGRASPRRSSIGAITSRTNTGAAARRSGTGCGAAIRLLLRQLTPLQRLQMGQGASRARRFMATTASPLRP